MKILSRFTIAGVVAGVIASATPSFAHHSFAAEFDASKCRDFSGTLTKVEWTNPHGFFHVDVKDQDGAVHNWSFQTYALITLRRAGTSLELFKQNIGKEVWVRGREAKNGRPFYAAAGSLKFASDGVLRQMGQLQD
jgi:Family of unknown function (DUF6152)